MDNNIIKRICADFKEGYGFNITALVLEREQYEQMRSMGLYSGVKKRYFKR